MTFDRKIFFDAVRGPLFNGSMTQQQVDGMNFKLAVWETDYADRTDLRWLAYPLATSWWETAQTMWPIEEYGKGKGQPYGVKDPETGQAYYGRGDVQMTWRDNYRRATQELMLTGADDLEWHADRALDPEISAAAMFEGMIEGWYRSSGAGPCNLERYFSDTVDDPFNARDIINGDKNKVVDGGKIGDIIATSHGFFLDALRDAETPPWPVPEPPPVVTLDIRVPEGILLDITVNGVMR